MKEILYFGQPVYTHNAVETYEVSAPCMYIYTIQAVIRENYVHTADTLEGEHHD